MPKVVEGIAPLNIAQQRSHFYNPDDPANQPLPEGQLPDPNKVYGVELQEGELSGDEMKRELDRFAYSSDIRGHWGDILTGSIASIPERIRITADVIGKKITPEEREERLLRTINQSWVADHLKYSRHQIRHDWTDIRDNLSKGRLIAADEEELFYALSEEQLKYDYEDYSKALFAKGYEQGLLSGDPEAWQQTLAKQKEKVHPSKHSIIERYAQEAINKGNAQREKLLPIAQILSEGIEGMVAAEHRIFSPEQIVDSAGSAQRAASQLRKLSREERQLVYHLCLQERRKRQGQRSPDQEGLTSRVLRSAKRGATNIGFDLGLGVMHLSAGALNTVGYAVDDTLDSDLQGKAQNVDLRARVAHEIRNFAQQQVAPLYIPEDASLGEQFMIDMAGIAPSVYLGFGGVGAWAGLTGSGIGSSISGGRERNAEGNISLQTAAGVVGAGIQEAISYGFARRSQPIIEKMLSQFMKAKGQGARSYTLAGLRSGGILTAETTRMLIEQKAGSSADLALHEASSYIDQTNSNIDWQSYGSSLTDIEQNLREAAHTLPYLLIGAGRAQLHHFEQARDLKNNTLVMHAWGVPEKDIADIVNEDNMLLANKKLQHALQQSPHWGGLAFLKQALQSLKLLNTDYFKGFKTEEDVRDFLDLKGEARDLPHVQEQLQPIETDAQLDALHEKHGTGHLKGSRRRIGQVLEVWDYLWRRSNLDRLLPPSMQQDSHPLRMNYIFNKLRERHERNLAEHDRKEPIVPLSLLRGFYSPQAEQRRRVLLHDRVAEVQDMSYLHTLFLSSPEYLLRKAGNPSAEIGRREMKRQRFLDRIALEVISRAQGATRQESSESIRRAMTQHYRHFRNESISTPWAKQARLEHYSDMVAYSRMTQAQRERSKLPPEFFQACELVFGMERSVDFLYEMLPQMDDFHRLLGRGQTPIEAYATLLQRELGLTGTEFSKTYIDSINQVKAKSNLRKNQKHQQQQFKLYEQLTGFSLESSEGADGATYWRTRLPDGSPTRWHHTKQQAVADLSMSTLSIFRPLGESVMDKQRELMADGSYRVQDYINESQKPYSNFDIVGRLAFQDLYVHHVKATASGLPGLNYVHNKRRISKADSLHVLNFTPVDYSRKGVKEFRIDELSATTPYALLKSRAHAYWKNLLNTKMAKSKDLIEQLEQLGLTSNWSGVRALLSDPEVHPLNNSTQMLDPEQHAKMPRQHRVSENVAHILSTLSTDYLFATADDHPLPESFKTWLRLIPLAPAEDSINQGQHIKLGGSRVNLLQWSNRQAATKIQQRIGLFTKLRKMRRQIEKSPLMPFITSSLGLDKAENAERSWSHYYGGDNINYSQNDELWQLLTKPAEKWQRVSPRRQVALHRQLVDSYHMFEDRMEIYASPEHLGRALGTLDDVLQQYPELHNISLAPNSNERFISLELVDGSHAPPLLDITHTRPIGWQIPYRANDGYRYSGEVKLPRRMLQDARVLPSLRLLHDLRLLNSHAPVHNEQGIWWKGQRYGYGAAKPNGLGEHWKEQRPLTSMLPYIKEIQDRIQMSGGEKYKYLGLTFEPLDESIDMRSLQHASIYRNDHFPGHTLRLMPGSSRQSSPTMRSPYVVQVRNGVYSGDRGRVFNPKEADDFYTNLNYYEYREARGYSANTHALALRGTAQYHIQRLYNEIESEDFSRRLRRGEVDVEDLLVSLYEDTGLGYDLSKKSFEQLTPGQLTLLNICYNLAQIQYGKQKRPAYTNLKKLLHHIESKDNGVRHLRIDIMDLMERQFTDSMKQRREAIARGIIEAKDPQYVNEKDNRKLKEKYKDHNHLIDNWERLLKEAQKKSEEEKN